MVGVYDLKRTGIISYTTRIPDIRCQAYSSVGYRYTPGTHMIYLFVVSATAVLYGTTVVVPRWHGRCILATRVSLSLERRDYRRQGEPSSLRMQRYCCCSTWSFENVAFRDMDIATCLSVSYRSQCTTSTYCCTLPGMYYMNTVSCSRRRVGRLPLHC